MIPEKEVEKLSDKLSIDAVAKFFRKNDANVVYFHHVSDVADFEVTADYDFENSELQLPTLAIEEDVYLVVHSNKKLSQTLAKSDYQVGTIALAQLLNLAQSLEAVNGLVVQGNSCYFSVDIEDLVTEINGDATVPDAE